MYMYVIVYHAHDIGLMVILYSTIRLTLSETMILLVEPFILHCLCRSKDTIKKNIYINSSLFILL